MSTLNDSSAAEGSNMDETQESVSDSEVDLNRDVFDDTPGVKVSRRGVRYWGTVVRRSSIGWFSTSTPTNQSPSNNQPTDRVIDLLRTPSVQTFTTLKKKLNKAKNSPEWILHFLSKDGLGLLFESLQQLCNKPSGGFLNAILQVSCVECVRAVMDTSLGLDYIVDNKEFTEKLAKALDTDNVTLKIQVLELLAALCVYSKDGYTRAIDAIECHKCCIASVPKFLKCRMDGDTALSDKLDALVRAYDDTYELKDKQREALLFLAGKKGDLIVNLPVGYGKSIIYHILPKILGENVTRPVVLVISPLNVIQKDQRAELRRRNITCCRLSISATVEEDSDSCERFTCSADQGVEQLVNGDFSVVLSHPEAILNTKKGREILNSKLQSHVVAVVIDECHILDKWGEEFRTAFKELKSLKAFFPEVPFVALSGTLTCEQKMILPKELSLINHAVIECSPDKPNIFLEKIDKGKTTDVEGEYEEVTHRICDQLFLEKEKFPVTLLFLPVKYMSQVLMYLNSLFKPSCIDDSIYSAICSGQDQYVIEKTVQELKKSDPRIRLVLTTSILGMGFDPENVCQIVHACPPRNISQYFQEIGRAGRRNQSAIATLHYNSRNIAKNLPGMNDDMISYCKNDSSCLRNNLLSVFGFTKASDIKGCKCCSFCKRICTCGTCFTSNGLSLDS